MAHAYPTYPPLLRQNIRVIFDGVDSSVMTPNPITIRDTAALIAELVGFAGETVYNPEQPDGTPRKLLATDRINALGWQPRLSLQAGLADAYRWYLSPA